MLRISKCSKCKYYLGNRRCPAFPEGITSIIYEGKINHNTHVYGQVQPYVYSAKDEYKIDDVKAERYLSKLKEDLEKNFMYYEEKLINLILNEIKIQGYEASQWVKVILDIESSKRLIYHTFKIKTINSIDALPTRKNFVRLIRPYALKVIQKNTLKENENRMKINLFPNGKAFLEFSSTFEQKFKTYLKVHKQEMETINNQVIKEKISLGYKTLSEKDALQKIYIILKDNNNKNMNINDEELSKLFLEKNYILTRFDIYKIRNSIDNRGLL